MCNSWGHPAPVLFQLLWILGGVAPAIFYGFLSPRHEEHEGIRERNASFHLRVLRGNPVP